MSKSSEYRRKEKAAAAAAQKLSDPVQRDQQLAIAKAWRELADRAERCPNSEPDNTQPH